MPKIEIRSMEVWFAVDTDTRTISGIAVPYGVNTNVGDFIERFDKGAFGDSVEGVKLFYGHENPIGLVTKGTDTDNGFEIEARISKTAKGDEVYELLRDGVLNKFSVGFVPVEDRMDEDVTVRTKATLKEVSVVPFPAYDGATICPFERTALQIAGVTAAGNTNNTKGDNNMSEINYASADDVADLRSSVDEIDRRMSVIGNDSNDNAGPQFRSGGDFLKALRDGDSAAQNEIRAFTGANGGTLSDSHTSNDWKGVLLNIVNGGRPVLDSVESPLGDHGMNVEYAKVSTLTGDVAVQAAEADLLAYMEVGITTASAPVKTYGGYSELSRQAIERSDVSYLRQRSSLSGSVLRKGNQRSRCYRAGAATPQTGTAFGLGAANAASFLGAVVDGVQKINDNGLGAQADFILVSVDVYQKLANLVDTNGRPLFNINGDGANAFGNINVRGIAGALAGLPVVVNAALPVRTMYVASSTAVTTWENGRRTYPSTGRKHP